MCPPSTRAPPRGHRPSAHSPRCRSTSTGATSTASRTAPPRGISTYPSTTAARRTDGLTASRAAHRTHQQRSLTLLSVRPPACFQILRLVLDPRCAGRCQRPHQSVDGRQARCDARTAGAAQLRTEQRAWRRMRRGRKVGAHTASERQPRSACRPVADSRSLAPYVFAGPCPQLRRVRVHAQVSARFTPIAAATPGACRTRADPVMLHISASRRVIRYGLPDESCANYVAESSAVCDQQAICSNCMPIGEEAIWPYRCWAVPSPILFYVHEYGQVHGEAAMMSEIHARGPITCGFASVDDFDYNYVSRARQKSIRAAELNSCTTSLPLTHSLSLLHSSPPMLCGLADCAAWRRVRGQHQRNGDEPRRGGGRLGRGERAEVLEGAQQLGHILSADNNTTAQLVDLCTSLTTSHTALYCAVA